MRRAFLFVGLALSVALPLRAAAATKDIFAIVVTRHGVRSISKPLPQYNVDDWRPVPPSYLTARGYSLVTYLGQYYRLYFASRGIPVECGAPNVFMYADTDQRTMLTGRALIQGMCGSPSAIALYHRIQSASKSDDPLFNATQWLASRHRIDPHASRLAVLAALRDTPSSAQASAIVQDKHGLSELAGPLKAASTYAEDLFLQYAQCDPHAPSPPALASAMRMHVLAYDINARNSYNPRVRAGTLFAHIAAMLEAKARMSHPHVQIPDIAGDDAAFFSGHDTQLGALGGILGAHWAPGGDFVRDDMPPGSALVFELYRDAQAYRVRMKFVYETMEQFRHYKLLRSGVASVPVQFAGCTGSDCSMSLTRFARIADDLQRDGFVREQWTSDTSEPIAFDPLLNPKWTRCSP